MFISITDFDMEETFDSSRILITVIDEMGKPEEIKRFDINTNYDHGKWIQVGYLKNESNGRLNGRTFKALIKLPRKTAIFEYSSSNGSSSFTLLYECRRTQIIDTGGENHNHFPYLVELPPDIRSNRVKQSCEERSYKEWESDYCITTFQGLKCSRI